LIDNNKIKRSAFKKMDKNKRKVMILPLNYQNKNITSMKIYTYSRLKINLINKLVVIKRLNITEEIFKINKF
jgi:hypothetical protein